MSKQLSKQEYFAENQRFLDLLDKYRESPSNEVFQDMYMICYKCACSIAKKSWSDLSWEDIAGDATIYFMSIIKNGRQRRNSEGNYIQDVKCLPAKLAAYVKKYAMKEIEAKSYLLDERYMLPNGEEYIYE